MPKIIIPELEALAKIPPRNKDWSDMETETLVHYYPTVPTKKIAKAMGRSYYSVREKARSLGLEKRANIYILQRDGG